MSYLTGPRWRPEATDPQENQRQIRLCLVLTDTGTTGRRAFQHWAAFTACGVRCYRLWNSCCQHLYSCISNYFLQSCFLLQYLSHSVLSDVRRVLASVAELRFRTNGGMVEPLIYRKEKERERLGCLLTLSYRIHNTTSVSLFKAVYLLLLPPWTPERQISIWSWVKQIKWNTQHPSKGSKNTQETEQMLGLKPLMWSVWLRQITGVYIQLLQWFVMISLFSL